MVEIGEKSLDFSEEFRLFLCTRNPALELPPFASAIVNPVNFTTTRAGLTSQVKNSLMDIEKLQKLQK